MTAADVNGDGKPDLIVAGSHAGSDDLYYLDGSVSVFPGHGDGTFGSPAEYPVRNGAWRVVVGDFTHDGVLDVATANRSAKLAEDYCGELWDTVSILPGNAGGTFGAAASFTLTPQTNLADTRFRNSVMTLASVDVNADGYPDLVASWGAVILSQPPDPNWPPTVTANASAIDSSGSIQLTAPADDVDQDALTYTWSDSGGQWIEPTATPCRFTPSTGGPHAFTVTVDDGHGHTASSSVTVDFGTSSGGGSGPTITVTAPTAGETVAGGVPYTIHWTTSSDISGDDLLFTYSTDNGTTWTHISECDYSVASKGQCTWNNPGPDSTQAFLMICNRDSDVGHTCGAAGPFTIKSATGLPYPWQSGDIGAVGAAGSATYSNGVFTVTGSGADIWGAADAFQYVRQLRNTDPGPDFELDTFVESVQNVNAWTKAGLMVRSTLDAGSMHASVFVTPGKGIAFQRRTTAGGTSVNTQIASITAPVWLRLTVTRNRVDAFYRKTATDNWAPIGSQLYSSPSGYPFAYAGLAVTSHSDGTLARATFSHVAIDPAPPALTFARIGTATGDGSQDLINNTVSMTARGADIWGTADQFTYGSIPWSGDGTITTEVRLLDNTSSWAKAGPMFRDGTDVGSPHVSLFVTPGKGIAMQYRATAGGTSVQVAQVSGVVPVYLRLTRQGNMFTAAWSTDLSAWHTVGSISVALAASGGHAGLALTSHNTSVTADGTFADLTIQ